MPKYVFAFRGGSVPETEEESAKVMAAWTAWFEELGSAIVEPGNPFGPSLTVNADGSASEGGTSGLSGYTVVNADSLEQAGKMAAASPIFNDGGGLDVYEAVDM